MTAATLARPYVVPRNGGSGRAIVLAVLMHLLLGGLLFFGIRWQSSPPAVVQAELWSAVPQTAAPAPRPVPPQPKVETPTPPKVEPAPEPPKIKADIVEKAPVKVEPPKKVVPPKAEAPPPKPQPKPEPPAPKVEPKPKAEPVKALPRQPSDLASLLASAEESVAKTGTGKDQQTSGPRGRDTYIGRLVTAIRSQMRYPASSPGNPYVTMRIEQLPNGEVVNVTVTRPSGVQAFDDAVERAVRAASPLPRDEQGKVERVLNLDYRMYENK